MALGLRSWSSAAACMSALPFFPPLAAGARGNKAPSMSWRSGRLTPLGGVAAWLVVSRRQPRPPRAIILWLSSRALWQGLLRQKRFAGQSCSVNDQQNMGFCAKRFPAAVSAGLYRLNCFQRCATDWEKSTLMRRSSMRTLFILK